MCKLESVSNFAISFPCEGRLATTSPISALVDLPVGVVMSKPATTLCITTCYFEHDSISLLRHDVGRVNLDVDGIHLPRKDGEDIARKAVTMRQPLSMSRMFTIDLPHA